ncbi:hypothetical protein [Caballeronia sp. LjRoot31]|uniref:hypothetical protein n=1 Tax=Caballeronia sp. LjRoot31 TaxID=3342324 RepID=UPI003ECFCAAB
MKKAIEVADLTLKILSCFAVIGAGAWAVWIFVLGGSTGWQANVTIETQVLPYHDDLRLLVVHVKSKNPRNVTFELDSAEHDSYWLHVRKLAGDAKAGAAFGEDEGEAIKDIDLLKAIGGDYVFIPNAEMDDMQTIVVPVGTTISLNAEMRQNNGTLDKRGKPDFDFESGSTVVHIGP